MSKTEQVTSERSKDNFAVFQQSSDKYFADVERAVPRFQHAITDLQDEYFQAWKNMVNSTISMQKEYAIKSGFSTNLPEATQKIVENMTEEIIKARAVRDKIALATIESIQKNIKTCNDNAKSFADLNRNIAQSWIAVITPKQNE